MSKRLEVFIPGVRREVHERVSVVLSQQGVSRSLEDTTALLCVHLVSTLARGSRYTAANGVRNGLPPGMACNGVYSRPIHQVAVPMTTFRQTNHNRLCALYFL